MKRLSLSCVCALAAIWLVWASVGCAKQGYPSGGPKDTTPPVAGTPVPPSGSTGFKASEFFIPFDEYVTVKDAENNVLVSPPMKKKPEYVGKGKGLLVRIKDTLMENTTYLFQFKGAVADINEGNVLESLEYCFSTGSSLDSMSLAGWAVDGLSLKPSSETVSVMLYDSGSDDSAVVSGLPRYVTRCDKRGAFRFNNIRGGCYRIVALADDNKDLKFTAGEAVAFADGEACSAFDADTTMRLLLSAQKVEKQRVAKSGFTTRGKIQLVMQCPVEDFDLRELGAATQGLAVELNKGRDTITAWCRDEACDSMVVVLRAGELQDTLKLRFRGKGKSKSPLPPAANIALVKSRILMTTPYFDSLRLDFVNPLKATGATDSVVCILDLKDSASTHARILTDTLGLHGVVDFGVKAGHRYEVKIAAGTLTDIYGHLNDSVKVTTEVTTPERYGTLSLTLTPEQQRCAEGGQYVVQLLDESLKLVAEQAAQGSQRIVFDHLKAGKYKVRTIVDDNANARWDAGDYWQHRQPERVVYLDKTLDLRENWEMEEKLEL